MSVNRLRRIRPRLIFLLVLLAVLGGCAMYAKHQLSEAYGPSQPKQRMVDVESDKGQFYHDEVQPIIEQRCMVCHGCYDAPCQLKLTSPEGIDRGANKTRVYDGTRLVKAEMSRLFLDHDTTEEWRDNGFSPVLNERDQTPKANLEASVMARLLKLKQTHPLPEGDVLPDSFDFSLGRNQQCPTAIGMDSFEQDFPNWGMPYGLPGLNPAEHGTLMTWLKDGAKMAPLPELGKAHQRQVDEWETFLNGDSLKQQLVSRYLYEHWFLAHIYFSDRPAGEFFRVVRSRTPPGQPIDMIATRRPYDDPGVDRVYYRLWRERGTVLEKTHMPYGLNAARLAKYEKLFMEPEYDVERLPSYEPGIASNPFVTFEAIPGVARYRFLLEEAQFTIMNFIKGPVCRGQVALNVINDHFWVFFVEPSVQVEAGAFDFYARQQNNLALPGAAGSNAFALTNWIKYSNRHGDYLQAKAARMNEAFPNGKNLTTDAVWDGEGSNPNAALTVFRHFDTASVTKGLVGQAPKTAWIIDYSLLERIHYLLVAGFDVYGNVGHQLNTRLYMDFLRMEGEFNFLALLPPEQRPAELEDWYRGVSDDQMNYLLAPFEQFMQPSGVEYQTDQPTQELYQKLQAHLRPVLTEDYSLDQKQVPDADRRSLSRLQKAQGGAVTQLSQTSVLTVAHEDGDRYYTLLRNNAHSNITSLLNEDQNRLPDEDTITVAEGFIGAYPETFLRVNSSELDVFVQTLLDMESADDYTKMMDRFGVRRTSPQFWKHGDSLQQTHKQSHPYLNGLLDYSRLDNR